MTAEEFSEKMQYISKNYDTEAAHGNADDLMCEVLTELGFGEGVEVFRLMDKWYA